jgi:HTH-type transcriptional regulator / antitoxin HigA
LMHELGHLLGSQARLERYLDNDLASEPVTEIERKTNQFARDALIPRDKFDAFVQRTNPYFSRNAVAAFAEELGIHPAIVVGRLQYENLIPYTNLRNLLGKASPVFAEYLRS